MACPMIKAYSTESDMSPQDRAPDLMAGLRHRTPGSRALTPLHAPCPQASTNQCWLEGQTWEGQAARGPWLSFLILLLELENPVREQGPPGPWKQEVGEKATPEHRSPTPS